MPPLLSTLGNKPAAAVVGTVACYDQGYGRGSTPIFTTAFRPQLIAQLQ